MAVWGVRAGKHDGGVRVRCRFTVSEGERAGIVVSRPHPADQVCTHHLNLGGIDSAMLGLRPGELSMPQWSKVELGPKAHRISLPLRLHGALLAPPNSLVSL
jgi:hypothetical protein